MKEVSIVIATYNRSKLVVQAIESVLRQDFPDYELLVIDDGSTDDTLECLRQFESDLRVRIISRHHVGAASAMNVGIRNAIGKYIMFLGSDDIMLPNCVSQMYKFIEDQHLDFAWAGFEKIHAANGELLGHNIYAPDTTSKMFAYYGIGHIGSGRGFIIQKQLFENVGLYDEALTVGIDCDWMIRYGVYHYPDIRCSCNPKVLLQIRMEGQGQISHRVLDRALSFEAIRSKHEEIYASYPHIHACLFYSQAAYFYMGYEAGLARQNVLRSLKLNPMRLASLVLLLKVFAMQILGKGVIRYWRRRC